MYEDYDNEDFERTPEGVELALENWQRLLMRKLVEENFNNLSSKGFSKQQLYQWDDQEIAVLIETFNYMIGEFEADEEYEKCAILIKARQSLVDRKPFEPVDI